MKATRFTPPCIPFEGSGARYQNHAAAALTAAGREPSHVAWISSTCDTTGCLEPEHLVVQAPIALAYPYGICTYCGRSGYTKDHLLPRHWHGNARRRFVAIVPACGTCNSVLGDTLTWSITERRAICHARLRRKYARVLRIPDRTEVELAEFGHMMREYIREGMADKREVLKMLDWPSDPQYDARALQMSGIADPYAIGLILVENPELTEAIA